MIKAESKPSAAEPAWTDLVRRLRSDDPSAMEDLYRVFSRRIRFYLWRHVGAQETPDRLHDIFLIVTESIRSGDLRDPDCLMSYVRTVVRRQIAGHLDTLREQRQRWCSLECTPAMSDGHPGPEHGIMRRQHRELAGRILRSMRRREREVLMRFYVQEQPARQICADMELSETQFRLLKSRAKARLATLCRGSLRTA